MKEIPKIFNAYSRYYDLLYQDKDYKGESEYISTLLNNYGLSKGKLLEFGSGTGKHGLLLANLGYKVHGIEKSTDMIKRAKQIDGFTCQQGDICTVKTGQKYEAVVSLFHVVSYQVTNEKVQSVFQRASEHLQTEGLFLFDFWYSPAVYNQRPEVRIKRMSDEQYEIVRIAEPMVYTNSNKIEINFTVFVRNLINNQVETFNEVHPMRHFSLPEIELIGNASGFRMLNAEEFLTGKSPSENTWGVCVVMKKDRTELVN